MIHCPQLAALLAVVAAALLYRLPGTDAVKAEDFKRCDQAAFCARNRAYADAAASDTGSATSYVVDADSVNWSLEGEGVFVAQMRATNPAGEPVGPALALQVTTHTGGIVRVHVDEVAPIRKRYQVRDVLIGEGKHLSGAPFKHSAISGGFRLAYSDSGTEYACDVFLAPFAIDVYVDGQMAVSLNRRGWFQFEHYREKPAPKADDTPATPDVAEPNDADPASETTTSAATASTEGAVEAPLERSMWEEKFGSHTDSKPFGPASVAMDVTFMHSAHVYGIPEHAANLSLMTTRGSGARFTDPYRLYNLDVFEYELDRSEALYGSVPLMMSHARLPVTATRSTQTVGFFWLNAAETWVDISKEEHAGQSPLFFQQQPSADVEKSAISRSTTAHWISESGVVDAFILLGPTPKRVQQQYAYLTGTSVLPAQFALGYHQCRWNYIDQADVAQVHDSFEEHNIPVDVIWLDIEHTDDKRYFSWNAQKFAEPIKMLDSVAAKGRKMVTIVDPHIKRVDDYYVKKEASEKSLFVQSNSGGEYEGWCWPGSSSWVDYTNPEARKWWANLFRYDKYVGSTSALYTWNDMNEPSVFTGPEITMPKDNLHWQQTEHRDVHNIYGMYLHRATYSGHIVRSTPANDGSVWSNWLPGATGLQSAASEPHRPFVLSRAFFAGTQRYGAIWTGDNMAQWSHLAAAPPMLLSISLAGVAFCGADVGGFFGNPDAELLTRWYQAGVYYPFFRAHAHIDTKRREPWLFGEPYTQLIREAIVQRYRLIPYWYTLFRQAQLDGVAPIRPMFMEFAEDENTFAMDDQYMAGSALMIKPVSKPVSEQGDQLDVYLPTGVQTWFNFHSLLAYTRSSSGTKRFSVPLSAPAVALQRAGTVLPLRMRERRNTVAQQSDPLTLRAALNSNHIADGEYYLDGGDGFRYASAGEFTHKLVAVRISDTELTVSARELSVPGDGNSGAAMKPHQRPFMGDHAPSDDQPTAPKMTLVSSTEYRHALQTRVERITLLSTAAILQRVANTAKTVEIKLDDGAGSTASSASLLTITRVERSDIYGTEEANEAMDETNVRPTWRLDIKVPPQVTAGSNWQISVPFKRS